MKICLYLLMIFRVFLYSWNKLWIYISSKIPWTYIHIKLIFIHLINITTNTACTCKPVDPFGYVFVRLQYQCHDLPLKSPSVQVPANTRLKIFVLFVTFLISYSDNTDCRFLLVPRVIRPPCWLFCFATVSTSLMQIRAYIRSSSEKTRLY